MPFHPRVMQRGPRSAGRRSCRPARASRARPARRPAAARASGVYGGHAAVRRIDDERRPAQPLAAIEPERVVGARDRPGRRPVGAREVRRTRRSRPPPRSTFPSRPARRSAAARAASTSGCSTGPGGRDRPTACGAASTWPRPSSAAPPVRLTAERRGDEPRRCQHRDAQPIDASTLSTHARSLVQRRAYGAGFLTEVPVHQLLRELDALVFQELRVLLEPAVERHAHLPRTREHVRILDRRLVLDHVRRERRVALDDVQRVAVIVAGAVEPASGPLKLFTSTTSVSPSQRPFDHPIQVSVGLSCAGVHVDDAAGRRRTRT